MRKRYVISLLKKAGRIRQSGSGTMLFSVTIIIPMLLLMILVMVRFNLFSIGIAAQSRADAFAIMEAEYSKTPTGMNVFKLVRNQYRAERADQGADGKTYSRKLNLFNPKTHQILSYDNITVSASATGVNLYSGAPYTASANATSRIILVDHAEIDYDAFPKPNADGTIPDITPVVMSLPSDRSVEKYMDVIDQFKLGQGNERYLNIGLTEVRQMVLLRDFTMAMGCALPIRDNTGKIYTAKALATYMKKQGPLHGWSKAGTVYAAIDRVNKGQPVFGISSDYSNVIILAPDPNNEGSVKAVYANANGMSANAPLPNGGYQYFYHK